MSIFDSKTRRRLAKIGRRSPPAAWISLLLRGFYRNVHGVTAIEYAIILAGISVAIIVSVDLVGNNLAGTFNSVNEAIGGASGGGSSGGGATGCGSSGCGYAG